MDMTAINGFNAHAGIDSNLPFYSLVHCTIMMYMSSELEFSLAIIFSSSHQASRVCDTMNKFAAMVQTKIVMQCEHVFHFKR
jgi:hypothetical protein